MVEFDHIKKTSQKSRELNITKCREALLIKERTWSIMNICEQKIKSNVREAKEIKILKRFFGVLLFVLAVFFKDIYVKLPGNAGLALALLYFLIQYWLWIGKIVKK